MIGVNVYTCYVRIRTKIFCTYNYMWHAAHKSCNVRKLHLDTCILIIIHSCLKKDHHHRSYSLKYISITSIVTCSVYFCHVCSPKEIIIMYTKIIIEEYGHHNDAKRKSLPKYNVVSFAPLNSLHCHPCSKLFSHT